jgi:hypothetical protein
MNSKIKFVLVFMSISASGCLHSQPASKNSDPLKASLVAKSLNADEVRVKILTSNKFESLTPQFVLDPQMRDGFSAFTEDLLNEGEKVAHIWFQARGGVRVETRIHEEAVFQNTNLVHVSRNRVSFADFAIDQLDVTRASGEQSHFSTQEWRSFDLSPGETVHLAWIAHASSEELCPFWAHQKYAGIGMFFLVPGTLDWSIVGASLAFNVARNLKVATGDQGGPEGEPKGQSLVDSQDSAESNVIAGDGIPNTTDSHFSCDGLMELLPSGP